MPGYAQKSPSHTYIFIRDKPDTLFKSVNLANDGIHFQAHVNRTITIRIHLFFSNLSVVKLHTIESLSKPIDYDIL